MTNEELQNLTDEQMENLIKTTYRDKILHFAKLGGKEEIAKGLLNSLNDKSTQTPAQRLLLQKIKQHIKQGTVLSKIVLS